jgi:hypothetical protein
METTNVSILDSLTKAYAKARQALSERVAELQSELTSIRNRKIGGIKTAAAQASNLQAELRTFVEANPDLFTRPRTMTLSGIKVGYQKGKGSLDWDDNTKVVELIRKHLPEQADVLIITEEKPSADALRQLSAKELAKIGVRIENASDQVLVKATDSEVDKLVAKILEEGAKEAA